MDYVYTVNFFWKTTQSITLSCTLKADDQYSAYCIAWGFIRAWFQTYEKAIPEFVRDINMVGEDKTFNWNVIDLTTSDDLLNNKLNKTL